MKKIHHLLLFSISVFFLFLCTTNTAFSQVRPGRTKVNPTVVTTEKPSSDQSLESMETIPHFKNIVPETPGTSDQNISRSDLKPVALIPPRKFNVIPSSVNGTMTARNTYLNSNAYIEFTHGDLLTGEDKVRCICSKTEPSIVRLFLQATAGKDYMITVKVSRKAVNQPINLYLSSSGFSHQAEILNENQEVKIILSPQSTGQYNLGIYCNQLTSIGSKIPWTFHSISVKEVN